VARPARRHARIDLPIGFQEDDRMDKKAKTPKKPKQIKAKDAKK
jgi:hypothetical protein